MSPSEGVNALAEAMAQIQVMLEPILEAATGYKKRCEAAGFNAEAASSMAAEFHNAMLAFMTSKMTGR